ncbi:hypothetical protein A2U01_0111012, partial [Trifolium medium]|nr:hypothetical protein [Trifolium medium]
MLQPKARDYAGSQHHAPQRIFASADQVPQQTRVASNGTGQTHAARHEPMVLQPPQAGA